jgi:hypothetical protein
MLINDTLCCSITKSRPRCGDKHNIKNIKNETIKSYDFKCGGRYRFFAFVKNLG